MRLLLLTHLVELRLLLLLMLMLIYRLRRMRLLLHRHRLVVVTSRFWQGSLLYRGDGSGRDRMRQPRIMQRERGG